MFKNFEQKLVKYEKYRCFFDQRRSQNGITNCAQTPFVGVFLVSHLNFNWDEVHQVAEQLEHIQSEKLTNELERFLDYTLILAIHTQ